MTLKQIMLPDSNRSTTLLGNAGEHAVGQWLQQQGYRIHCYNYRTRGGEIDLIAQREEIISFIEVKVRTTHYFNSSQLITKEKQRKIIQTARIFCMRYGLSDVVVRFDVALLQPTDTDFEITYIPNAFTDTTRNCI